jgi:hypothetical protein
VIGDFTVADLSAFNDEEQQWMMDAADEALNANHATFITIRGKEYVVVSDTFLAEMVDDPEVGGDMDKAWKLRRERDNRMAYVWGWDPPTVFGQGKFTVP